MIIKIKQIGIQLLSLRFVSVTVKSFNFWTMDFSGFLSGSALGQVASNWGQMQQTDEAEAEIYCICRSSDVSRFMM